MKRLILLIALVGLSTNLVYGQIKKVVPINISYFGETLVHPGITIGYENTFYRSFIFTVSMGTHIHQRNHTGLFFNAGLNWRHTFPIGYSMEFGLGLGYLHAWAHGGSIYTVDDAGDVSIKRNFGRPHFMPSVKLGLLGWDFRNNTDIPLRLNADLIVFGRYPFNNFIMPHMAFNIGGTYYLSF
ncbi:MAG: hypothetical protein FWG77_08900 [Treponema sp.]|nr:hypothetical protein [Treponema sp.]